MNEFEITVKVNLKLKDLLNYLNNNNFKFHRNFQCNDIYLIDKKFLKNKLNFKDLNHCLIIRNMIFTDKLLKYKLIKTKTYDEHGNIIENIETKENIENIEKTKNEYLEKGYIELVAVNDNCYTYSKDGHEFIVENISNLGTFIEFESRNFDSNIKNGSNINDLIKLFDSFKIDYDRSNYFCKKAWLLLKQEKPELCN